MHNSYNKINIAIDGPAGAGKSTAARQAAQRLQYVYVDTGAMYRAVTLKILRNGLKLEQASEIADIATSVDIVLIPGDDGQKVMMDGEDVTDLLRTQEVNRAVSSIASIRQVRERLVLLQKKLSFNKGVVMDGRDIGSKVLPDAEVKIYLTASVEERARRRYDEMKESGLGNELNLSKIMEEIAERDRMDQQREISPLIVPDDAIVIDSSAMDISQVVEEILRIARDKIMAEE